MSKSIGIIGMGKMGRCLAQGLIKASKYSKSEIFFTTKHAETADKVAKELGVTRVKNNAELVAKSEIVLVAVKPQNVHEVLAEVQSLLTPKQTVISIAASISTSSIEKCLSQPVPVLRAMPNTPALVGAGITAVCLGKNATERDYQRAEAIFTSVGRMVRVDEKHLNAVTGLSGCGPAYIYLVLESLTDGGIKVGLPRELATELACQTVLGAATMLRETGKHPAALKDEVTTPAGCTIDGLMELEEGKLRVTLIKAVVQATRRARLLAKQTDK